MRLWFGVISKPELPNAVTNLQYRDILISVSCASLVTHDTWVNSHSQRHNVRWSTIAQSHIYQSPHCASKTINMIEVWTVMITITNAMPATAYTRKPHSRSNRPVQQYLWPPYVIGGPLYFCPVVSFLPSIFFFLFFPRLISAAVDRMSAILLHMAWP